MLPRLVSPFIKSRIPITDSAQVADSHEQRADVTLCAHKGSRRSTPAVCVITRPYTGTLLLHNKLPTKSRTSWACREIQSSPENNANYHEHNSQHTNVRKIVEVNTIRLAQPVFGLRPSLHGILHQLKDLPIWPAHI